MTDAVSPDSEEDKAPSLLKRLAQLVRGGTATAIRENLEEIIEESERQSPALSAQERTMLSNLLKVGELKVSDVMVPRADIISVELDTPVTELVALFGDAQHSRLPVYRETLDDPVGLVHIKDVLALIEPQDGGGFRWRAATIDEIKRPILFAAPSMPVLDLLVKMQTTHIQLALVIDEYGGTDGLVSIEDLIEEIVGEIEDEFDVAEVQIEQIDDDTYRISGMFPIDEFNDRFGTELPDEDFHTVGGYVFGQLGRAAEPGDDVSWNGVRFDVLEVEGNRIEKIGVTFNERPAVRRPEDDPFGDDDLE